MQAQLILQQYKLNVNLGWTDDERQTKQIVYLDIKIKFSEIPVATKTDELAETICYHKLTQSIEKFCANKTFKLIEYLAHELLVFLRNKISVKTKLALRIVKPNPCPNLAASVFTLGDFLEHEI